MAQSSKPTPRQQRTRRWSKEEPVDLPSSSSPLAEEFKCFVCLDVFIDPVTIPCGHNFCKSCLNQCWENGQACSCPLCKESFSERPNLKINRALSEVAQLFKEKPSLSKSEVLCDICDDDKNLKALKSCLVCQKSYCESHLEPHRRVPNLKEHKLMDPVENIKDYICQKHERPLELFCRDDQMCVCVFCLEGDHKNHNTGPLEEESEEKKTHLMKTQTDMQQMIEDRIAKIQDIKHSAELRKKNKEQEKANRVELFTYLFRSIERCQTELLGVMEEKQKSAEKQDEDHTQELYQEIANLKRRSNELEQLSHTKDHLHLLQTDASLCSPPHTRNWSEMSMNTDVSVETLRKAVTQLQETLEGKISQTVLWWMQRYAVDVTLDPDTAHPTLTLSDDGKQVTHGAINPNFLDIQERFDCCTCVLGKEGFSSGSFYFEVDVRGSSEWDLGVARESVNRKGQITATPHNGYYTVALRNKNEYCAFADPPVPLLLRVNPEIVGVFVDYEEGLVSFYDVASRSHIYSFTAQSFTEKLYPYFCPAIKTQGKVLAPLIISPVNHI